MTDIQFTFVESREGRIIAESKHGLEDFREITVLAKNYPEALKRILKFKLPNINSEDDLVWISVIESHNEDDLELDFTPAT